MDLGRSVRRSQRSLPRRAGAPATVRCLEEAEEGNVVSIRHKANAPSPIAAVRIGISRGHVLHSVFEPVHVDRHYTSKSQGNEGGAFESVSRSGKLAQARGTGTEVGTSGRSAARRVSPLPQGRSRVMRQKRKEIAVSVPARTRRAPDVVPVRRSCCCRSQKAAFGLE